MSTKFLAMVQEVGVRGCLRARKHPSKETEVHAESLVGVRCSRNSAEALVVFAAVEIPLRRTFALRCRMKLSVGVE